MGSVWASVARYVEVVKAWGRNRTEHFRVRWPWFDHLLRTVHRYQTRHGDRLAGAVTYFAFLSFFPVLALGFAVAGYVVSINAAAEETLIAAVNQQLPGLADSLNIKELSDARAGAGVIGLLGLLYAGIGAVDALREALHDISDSREAPTNWFAGRGRDLVALVLIGLTFVLSVSVGGFANAATSTVLGWFGLAATPLAVFLVWVAGLLISIAADMLVFLVILGWLGKVGKSLKTLLRGALVGAVGFGVLKLAATLLLAHTLTNPVYGAFALVAGLLLYINFSARWIMYTAAWTATAEGAPPPEPSPVPTSEYV
ncbi:YihY/virulence factor BrkB family protein [Sphaerisporangium sp. TRM90804]|uniref:YihY/virulence factor BrkB family protein n=1 Tax=Sphaerisporangium sp. TRM90804 TaxID=3031113 RepID=UPI00244967EE|nr:YihY/virulence factor BrkB family protein [Sphaerisporangium sp. TRM90804]MDH2423915.1 YihY/virulence factor BrkB family protein [Sphaerisporangium sp. TRM90804]